MESLALQYVFLDGLSLRGVRVLLALLGFVLALLVVRSSRRLRRAPYALRLGTAFFGYVALQFIWLAGDRALLGGMLWLLMLADVLGALALGFASGAWARARAIDGFESPRWAILGAVPLANLMLLFKRPWDAERRWTVRGPIYSLVALFLFLLGGAVTNVIETRKEMAGMTAGPDADKVVAALIAGLGLAPALVGLAAQVPVPMRGDPQTQLVRVTAQGETLTYSYAVDTDVLAIPDAVVRGVVRHNCTYAPTLPVLRAGGALAHVYHNIAGKEIGRVTVRMSSCTGA